MKALIVMAMLFAGSSAFAGTYTQFGKILFQKASTYVPANKVCQLDGMLYHKTKKSIAVDYCNDDDQDCVTVNKALVQPVKSSRKRCAQKDDNHCLAWETVSFVQGTVKAKVYRSLSALQDDEAPIRVYSYTVENCHNF